MTMMLGRDVAEVWTSSDGTVHEVSAARRTLCGLTAARGSHHRRPVARVCRPCIEARLSHEGLTRGVA